VPVLKARIGGTWVDVGGGGADEVWVGPNTPTDANNELWIDTDEADLTDPNVARWNSAWGIVGVGTLPFNDGTIGTAGGVLTNQLVVTTVAGRRYRVSFLMRAIGNGVNSANTVTLLIDGTAVYERWFQIIGNTNYDNVNTEWIVTPSAGSHTFRADWGGTAGAAIFSNGGHFYVEDIGPVSLASDPPAQPASVWTAPTFLNGWSNYSTAVYQQAGYRKIGDQVFLRGLVKGGTLGVIFTLPVGFRPVLIEHFAVSSNDLYGSLNITDTGVVQTGAVASTIWVSLANIQFSTVA
jgi:hypothetical protein